MYYIVYFYIIHIMCSCYWSIITTLNENYSRKLNLFCIPISLPIVHFPQTLQFVIERSYEIISQNYFCVRHKNTRTQN